MNARTLTALALLLVAPALLGSGSCEGGFYDEGYYTVPATCIPPTSAEGGACEGDADCPRGTLCVIGTCGAPGLSGASCHANRDCEEGLACSVVGGNGVDAGVCHAPGTRQLGEGCARLESCAEGVCSAEAGYTCQPAGEAGDPCAVGGDCRSDLRCLIPHDGGPRTCAPYGFVGDPCTWSLDCQEGLACLFDPAGNTCVVPRAEEGEPCRRHPDSPLAACRAGTACDFDAGACRRIGAHGDPCAEGTCVEGLSCNAVDPEPTCVRPGEREAGQTCSSAAQCGEGLICEFEQHRCVPERSLGEGAWCFQNAVRSASDANTYCAPDLVCSYSRCVRRGSAGEGEDCLVDAECGGGNRCGYQL